MNEMSFLLAILIYQGILTKDEARKLQRAHSEGVISSNLEQMVIKVKKALEPSEDLLERVDATSLIK